MLSDRRPVCSVCLSVLPVTLLHCGQTVGRIKMKLGTQVGLGPAPPSNFRPCSYETAGWIKMALGTEVGLSPGDFVLDGDPARPLNFRPMFIIVIMISLEHCTSLLVCSRSKF